MVRPTEEGIAGSGSETRTGLPAAGRAARRGGPPAGEATWGRDSEARCRECWGLDVEEAGEV